MKKHKNRFCAILLCLITILALCPVQALAAGPIDTGAKCSLEIAFTPGGVKASGVEFKAYKVASVTVSCEFEVQDQFTGHSVTQLLEKPDAESYSLIASTLSGVIASDSKIKPDYTAVTNSSGIASFQNLETGLYLVIGEVYHGEEIFYTPQSFMVCLPQRLQGDLWNYDVSTEVKWEKRPDCDPVDLQVLKVWSDSATNLHTNDNVTVELYKNGTLYDTQILYKDNSWSYTWDDLYGGATWSVKEKEISDYTGTVERKGDCFVITNTAKSSSDDSGKKLPQTGLLWWPAPILLAGGILFTLIGLYSRRKGKNNEIR